MSIANLIEKRWLYRKFNVITPEGLFEVVYNGCGIGYEEIIVDEVIASRETDYWFVPEFQFLIGNLTARVKVKVWVWLQIRDFELQINGETIYYE